MNYRRRWHRANSLGQPKLHVSAVQLRERVVAFLGPILSPHISLHFGDNEYYCPSVRDAEEIIRNSAVDRNKWVAEKFDCDDFALVLKAHFAEAAYKDGQRRLAHCFGILWGYLPYPHAINWMLNNDNVIRFVEPQTDLIFKPYLENNMIWFMMT